MFLRAHTVARVQKRQVSVRKSKYVMYCESTGTITDVTTASSTAIHKTVFLLTNDKKLIAPFGNEGAWDIR